ncbi:MAG: hypothetical protein ACKV1O_07920 [Saprospiraceae bacterium]
MYIKEVETGKLLEVRIEPLKPKEYKMVGESGQFVFDWSLEGEQKNDLYKIYPIEEEDQILGLLSLKDVREELRIHVNLIEVSKMNTGKVKKYDRIAGCLLAYACQLAFERSYDGFVSLTPKTRLIDHYCTVYGFQQFGRQLGLGYEAAIALIKKFL